jgi:hypothetical protein
MSEQKCAICEKKFPEKEWRYTVYLGNVAWGAICKKCHQEKERRSRLENILLSKYSSRLPTPPLRKDTKNL